MTLVVSKSLNLEFIGWFLANYDHIIEKIWSKQLKFIFADNTEWVSVGELDVRLLDVRLFEDNRFKHFIDNATPVLRDKNSNFRIFAGDL
mmetsp:Transcript_12337/g.8984  ORF Transcript_12337/g.8984 Transcript_12337/m.8984 type:complete len:90 (+) Transcript_12337:68-337(+)